MTAPVLLTALFALAMVVAMVWDVGTYEIPDTVSVMLVLGALAGLVVGEGAFSRLSVHATVALASFAAGLGLFVARLWGGGDVKLFSATTFWFDWNALPAYLLAVAVAGGAVTLALMAFRRLPLPRRWQEVVWLARLRRPDQGVPYGVALGLGGLFCLDRATAAIAAGLS